MYVKKLDYRILKKKNLNKKKVTLYVMTLTFLEFVAANFNICSTFYLVQID